MGRRRWAAGSGRARSTLTGHNLGSASGASAPSHCHSALAFSHSLTQISLFQLSTRVVVMLCALRLAPQAQAPRGSSSLCVCVCACAGHRRLLFHYVAQLRRARVQLCASSYCANTARCSLFALSAGASLGTRWRRRISHFRSRQLEEWMSE